MVKKLVIFVVGVVILFGLGYWTGYRSGHDTGVTDSQAVLDRAAEYRREAEEFSAAGRAAFDEADSLVREATERELWIAERLGEAISNSGSITDIFREINRIVDQIEQRVGTGYH